MLLIFSSLSGLLDYGKWDSYYLSHIRFSELLVGSILAIALAEYPDTALKPRTADWLSAAALLTLVLCFFVGSFTKPFFPGPLALIPCLATVVLLYTGRNSSLWYSRLMSLRPIVWIGKISYSLYLWHWTLLALSRYITDGRGLRGLQLLGLVVLIFVCSALSYYYIEQPLRRRKWSFRSAFVTLYALPCLLLGGASKFIPYHEDKEWEQKLRSESKFLNSYPYEHSNPDHAVGDPSKELSVLIAGDSHAMRSHILIDSIGRVEGWRGTISALVASPYLYEEGLDSALLADRIDRKYIVTLDPAGYLERNQRIIADYQRYSTIILIAFWGYNRYHNNPRFLEELGHTLQTFLQAGKEVILVNSCYIHATSRRQELYISRKYPSLKQLITPSTEETRGEVYYQSVALADQVRSYVATHYPAARWIDLAQMLPEGLSYQGYPLLHDSFHLSPYGARYLAGEFLKHGECLVTSSTRQERSAETR